SFPFSQGLGPAVATARGGNIIGGGDWAEDRLITDFVRAVNEGQVMTLRNPDATRPTQHVLALDHGSVVFHAGLLTE
ncbi:CDP-glucose 4,6-dehydratase, partial [Pseudomonas syringae pv. tagetis]